MASGVTTIADERAGVVTATNGIIVRTRIASAIYVSRLLVRPVAVAVGLLGVAYWVPVFTAATVDGPRQAQTLTAVQRAGLSFGLAIAGHLSRGRSVPMAVPTS